MNRAPRRQGRQTNDHLARDIALAILVSLGWGLAAASIGHFGICWALGRPLPILRTLALVVVGGPLALGGYRYANGAWSGVSNLLHQAAAGTGLLFVFPVFVAWPEGGRAALVRAVPLAALGVAAVVSWRVRVARRGRRKPRG